MSDTTGPPPGPSTGPPVGPATGAPAGTLVGDDGARAQRPLTVIVPGRISLRQYLRDLVRHRDLALVLAVRDVKLRYRQTALGVAWVVLQPLLAAGILGFVFGRVAKLPTDGVPYFVFAFAGMLGWNAFSQGTLRSTSSLVGNAPLVSKIFFPRLLLPLSTVVGVVLDFGVALVMMVVMVFTNHLAPGAAVLLLPVWLLLVLMLAEGLGAYLASLAVRYRDVLQVTPVVLQLALYASPVAYAVSAIPQRFLGLYYLNPLSALLQGFRWSLLGTPAPPGRYIAYAAVVSVVAFLGGMLALERMESRFADVI